MRVLYTVIAIIFSAVTLSMCSLAKDLEARKIEHIEVPKDLPKPGNKDLYRAVQLYNIKIPKGVDFPTYNPKLEARGLTIYHRGKYKVQIGPAALVSWAVLASTLAHEFEVHCNQNFMAIGVLDASNLRGTDRAERQAYDYEINNARSFGLSESEITMIRETKDFFYPQ